MKSTDSQSSEKRDIFQYHFTSWPDHSVPRDTSAFLMFHHKLRSALAVDPGPIVVHCRYLFICLFICLFIYLFRSKFKIDVFSLITLRV